jgi:general secretion pathway protein E
MTRGLEIDPLDSLHTQDVAESLPTVSENLARNLQSGSLHTALDTSGCISREALDRAVLVAQESGERLDAVLTRLGLISEQSLAEALSRSSRLPLIGDEAYPTQAVSKIPVSAAFLHQMRCVPIQQHGGETVVAVVSPYDDFIVPALSFMFGGKIERRIGRASDIDAAIERLYRSEPQDIDLDAGADSEDLERLKDLVSDAPVIRAVNRLIARASDLRASDIHIEPTNDCLALRFRIDGVLRDMPSLPAAMRAPLVSRVKIMAGLNIAERRLPQDGRMRLAVRGHEIDLRVATAPGIHGESVVLRILDRSKLSLDFGSLGFDAALSSAFRKAVHQPHGIVLVTGPTGSGKTTTLYAALAELNRPERKVLTVEDPIEYRLGGVVQTQVNPAIGFSFGFALRSFLRQDPDVIMVGEIRDGETAEIAVQAALTGHMILSTLHTNTAAGAVTRLLDMGVEPFLLSSVLTAVVAQRLVRRLCPDCREGYVPEQELAALFSDAHLAVPQKLFRPTGCAQCGNTGYTGRLAVFELLSVDSQISKLILARSDTRTIAEAASGTTTLLGDGLAKSAQGLTSVEEVLRVVRGE